MINDHEKWNMIVKSIFIFFLYPHIKMRSLFQRKCKITSSSDIIFRNILSYFLNFSLKLFDNKWTVLNMLGASLEILIFPIAVRRVC